MYHPTFEKKLELIKPRLREEVLRLTALTTPEEVTDDWYNSRRDKYDVYYLKNVVIPKYGNYISLRDRELFLDPDIYRTKDGKYYKLQPIDLKNPSTWGEFLGLSLPKQTSKQLTEEDIFNELLRKLERNWINAQPDWEKEGVSEEEFKKKQAEQQAEKAKEEAEKKLKALRRTRQFWRQTAEKEYGRVITDLELESYMWQHESEDERADRELQEWKNTRSSFVRGGFKLYDRDVHKAMRWSLGLYIAYYYPEYIYTGIYLVILYYAALTPYFYMKIKDRAKQPFRPDPRSRKSEEWQRRAWEADRKRWGYDKEDEKKEDSNKKN